MEGPKGYSVEAVGIDQEHAPDILSMYSVSGFEVADKGSFEKYINCKKQDPEIADAAMNSDLSLCLPKGPMSPDEEAALKTEIIDRVHTGLASTDLEERHRAIEKIDVLPEDTKAEFYKNILLGDSDFETRKWAIKTIAVEGDVFDVVVKEILARDEPELQDFILSEMHFIPGKYLSDFIDIIATHPRPEVCFTLVGKTMLFSLPDTKRIDEVRNIVMSRVQSAIQDDGNIKVQTLAMRRVGFLSPANDPEGLKLVENLSQSALEKMTEKLGSDDLHGWEGYVEAVECFPNNIRSGLVVLLLKKIDTCLASGDVEAKINAVQALKYVTHEKAMGIAETFLHDDNPRLSDAARRIFYRELIEVDTEPVEFGSREASHGFEKIKGTRILQTIMDKDLAEDFIKPPIARDLKETTGINLENNGFRRNSFEKTGSALTILRGKLEGRVAIKHIDPLAFMAWQKAFESYGAWSDAGFDYVPIEPIISYTLDKDDLVNVSAGVLDMNYGEWLNSGIPMYLPELRAQMDAIIGVLNKINVAHGHTHEGNFCLRFFRDENGKPDLLRMPRLYLIDFDQAVSA